MQAPAEFKPQYLADFVQWIDRTPKTTRTYLSNLRQFAAWLKYSGIDQPTRDDIILYRQYLLNEHEAIKWTPAGYEIRQDPNGKPIMQRCKPATAGQYLTTVKAFFTWTDAAGIYPNIAKGIHMPRISQDIHRRDALTPAEVAAVEAAILRPAGTGDNSTQASAERATERQKRLYAMFLLTVNAGLRTIEISRANVKDMGRRDGIDYIFIQGKGRAEADQKKPIAAEVASVIRDYLNTRAAGSAPESPLFVATGNRSGGKRIASTTISTMLKRAMQAAGIDSDRITAHSLRHTTGTEIQRLTGDLYQAQKYMRHASPRTTEIYLHNETERAEAELAQKLYDTYHQATGNRAKLERIMDGMTPEQLEALAALAEKI